MSPLLQDTAEPLSAAGRVTEGAAVGATAIAIVLMFCAIITVPLMMEIPHGAASSFRAAMASHAAHEGVVASLPHIEDDFIYQSRFVSRIRKPYQTLLVSALGHGSRSVLLGRNNTLFHRNDVINVIGRGVLSQATRGTSASVNVIAGFRDQLNARGVPLLVVIVPGKSNVYPEWLSTRYNNRNGPPVNVDFASWKSQLRDRQVSLLDLTPVFWEKKRTATGPLFAPYDTHWSPEGVALGAATIAERVATMLGLPVHEGSLATATRYEPRDLVLLLGLDDDSPVFPLRRMDLSVSTASSDDADAPILLFGDSMTGYYADQRGSLADVLSNRIGLPVQRFVGAGSSLTGAIQTAFDARPRLLKQKKLVILEVQIGQLYGRTFSAPLRVP